MFVAVLPGQKANLVHSLHKAGLMCTNDVEIRDAVPQGWDDWGGGLGKVPE